MRIRTCVTIILILLLFIPVISDSVSGTVDPEDFNQSVIIHSYKSKAMQFSIDESSTFAYQYFDCFTFYSGSVRIYLNGDLYLDYSSKSSGSVVHFEIDPGQTVDLKIVLGDNEIVKIYHLKVNKNITVKDIDPDSEESYELTKSELVNKILIYCLIVFLASVFGVYFMYLHYKRKAAKEVRSLV